MIYHIQKDSWSLEFMEFGILSGSIFCYFVWIISTWFGILSGSSQTKRRFIKNLNLFWAFLLFFFFFWFSEFWHRRKPPTIPILGWPKTSLNENDPKIPPSPSGEEAQPRISRGHVDNQDAAHSGVSEQGPFCLSAFLPFCLSVFLSFCLFVLLSFCLSILVTLNISS